MARTRLTARKRREHLLGAALDEAREHGYTNMNRDRIAARAGVSTGLVTRMLGTMPQLRKAVMRAAVCRGDAEVVLQGLARRDAQALKAPEELRRAAVGLVEV